MIEIITIDEITGDRIEEIFDVMFEINDRLKTLGYSTTNADGYMYDPNINKIKQLLKELRKVVDGIS